MSIRHSAVSLLLILNGAALAGEGLERGWGYGGELECMHCKLAAFRAAAQEGDVRDRFEAGTGRDLRNYAPDRPADFKHMKLELDIKDMNVPRAAAKQTLTLAPVADPLETLTLNAEQLEIADVRISDESPAATGRTVAFTHDGKKLVLTFEPPLPPGADANVVIEYAISDPPDGLFWTPESPAWPGRPAQIHTQGQPETNRYWFPTHDFPNERLTTEIIASVPDGYLVSANGREASKPVTAGGRTTFHWLQDKDHVSYLVSLVIGKFDVVDLAVSSKLPLPVYVPPGKGPLVQKTYGRTAEMVRVFEKRFSEPYPWDRYAQLVVWNFGAGGMENTSASTMYDTAILEEKALQDDDLDGLISHELAHQWFGDLITCNTWAHIWLNEGWATYSTSLWYEERDGLQNGYIAAMWRTMRGIAQSDQLAAEAKGDALERPGMVSPVYRHPWEVFRRTSNPYPKGSSILHMLRTQLGEEVFFRAVGEYVDRYKNKTVETDDFRRTLEDVSGRSLERFFSQWCDRPGTPKLHVKASWSEKNKELKLVIEQRQFIDPRHPAFTFDLPVEVVAQDGTVVPITIAVDGKRHERTISLDGEPQMLLVDPDLHVLTQIECDAPSPWLIRQTKTDRSIASRLDALNFLRGKNSDRVRAGVAEVFRDASEWHSVRSEAAETLGKLGALDELTSALASGIGDARVRRAAIHAVADIGGEVALPTLAAHASDGNESYACRAAALEHLGKNAQRASSEHLPIFAEALKAESQHDQVRVGAIRGLMHLRHDDSIALITPYTRAGVLNRTRPEAIASIAKIGAEDEKTRHHAYTIVVPFLQDREERARRAAIDALVTLKDPEGLAELDNLISSTNHEETREFAQRGRERLAAAIDSRDALESAQTELERLRADLKRLENKVEERRETP